MIFIIVFNSQPKLEEKKEYSVILLPSGENYFPVQLQVA